MIFLTIWMLFSIALQDTIPPALQDTIPEPAVNDTIPDSTATDSTLFQEDEPEEETPDTVHIWKYKNPVTFDVAETDSTLRWVNMVNPVDRYYRNRGAITYRTGITGRPDGLELHSFETRHMNVQMEGMIINDPMTGAVHWNRIPIRKIREFREADFGATYRGRIRLIDHYLTQPRTYLNFDESDYNYRNLDFIFTQNIRSGTNIELSFWDRRDGGGYNRSGVEGRQAAARIYHQLSDRWLLKTFYLNNAIDREEPFGYLMDSPQLFPFNRFIATPVENSAETNQSSSDIYLQAHYRPGTDRDVLTEFGLHYQTNKWSHEYSADTLATDFKQAEFFVRQHLSAVSTELTIQGRAFWLNESLNQNLAGNQWLGVKVDGDLNSRIIPLVQLNGYASTEYWDDDRFSSEVAGRVILFPDHRISLSAFGGVLDRSPDLQAHYWQSAVYSGNRFLSNEQEVTIGGSAELRISNWLKTGVRGDIRYNENSVFVDSTDTFNNIDPYTHLSASSWIELDSRIFEGEVSATYKSYRSDSNHHINRRLDLSGDRVWLKGHLYWKNYLFDRATYVTAGVSGVVSPYAFRTAEYLPPLNRWQHGTNSQVNPSYYRLDLDVSARIRWFMLLLKWENVLDRVDQLGYFETTGYPMPERRFRLGLRILFTN